MKTSQKQISLFTEEQLTSSQEGFLANPIQVQESDLGKRTSDNEEFASQRGINALNDINQSIQNWQNFPTESPICGGDDGLPTELDGITFSKWRQESIKGYGNAIVPQVAYEIFKVIQQLDGNTIPR